MFGFRLREIALSVVLVISVLALAPTPARASSLDPTVCIEDGGSAECTAPQTGTFTYTVVEPLTIGTVYSEEDLYQLINGYNIYCSNSTQTPPYTWSPLNRFFPVLTWGASIVENGVR
jgi:hypothetical protein